MALMYLLSEVVGSDYNHRFVFKPEDTIHLIEYIATHNTTRWSIDTVQVYEPPAELTKAELEERKKRRSASALPTPLSRQPD